MSAQNGLLEFVSVLQSNDVGVVFEARAGCAFAVHIAAGGAGGVVAGVVDVDVAVSGIEDVVFADMVFRAEREPDAVAVGQANSINLITVHFWLATTGTVLYIEIGRAHV